MTEKLYKSKVSYYETDCMNIVHHSNYIRYFEDARIQFIVGQIDEEQLKAQWDLWSKSGGDKVIEEVNAVYAK